MGFILAFLLIYLMIGVATYQAFLIINANFPNEEDKYPTEDVNRMSVFWIYYVFVAIFVKLYI